MALIKGKQIQSVPAAKVVETSEKKFVTEAQVTSFTGKAELTDVEGAKTAASEALATARAAITGEISTAKTEAISGANAYTDAEIVKVGERTGLVEGRVTTVEGNVTAGLQDRYTKEEINQKLSQLGAGIKYKGTVASFEEIATKFPSPEEGWLVAVEGTKRFYVYDVETVTWEEFPIEITPCTTHTKAISIVVTDSQTVIKTGIKTNGEGALQTAAVLADDVVLVVNGVHQTKTIDYTVAVTENEVVITWKSPDFNLETTDNVSVIYNQIV